MKKLIIISSLVFSGCAIAPKNLPKPLPLIHQDQTVVIPPSLLLDCTPLTQLDPNRTYSQGDSVTVTSTWAAEHGDCMLRFQKLRNLTAKAFNINIDTHGNMVVPASSVAVSK
jgi:hypothetical protein